MLKPLHDNVVLKKEQVEAKTASGIILTGDARTSRISRPSCRPRRLRRRETGSADR